MYNNQFFTMQGYGFGLYSTLETLAQILLFVSVAVFILSMAMYFITKNNMAENGQERASNTSDFHTMFCSECGFKMQIEWQCCPICGNDGSKHEINAEEANIEDVMTPIEETQSGQETVESTELNDFVERIYQDDKEEIRKNSKKAMKSSKSSKNENKK